MMRPSLLLLVGLTGTAVANSRHRRQDADYARGYGKPGPADLTLLPLLSAVAPAHCPRKSHAGVRSGSL